MKATECYSSQLSNIADTMSFSLYPFNLTLFNVRFCACSFISQKLNALFVTSTVLCQLWTYEIKMMPLSVFVTQMNTNEKKR